MNKFRFTINALAIAIFTFAFASMAQAQATRTWVSGVGDDANPCSRTAPCKTFAGAISKTAVDGEIDALDSGGFGAVTITKSITIDGDSNLAGILAAGTTGVIVNVSAASGSNVVELRNLSINGAVTGTNGVRIINGVAGLTVFVERCVIFGFRTGNGRGISDERTVAGNLVVEDTLVKNNSGFGITLQGTGGTNATLNRVSLYRNSNGLIVKGAGGAGNQAVIRDSVASYHVAGAGLGAETSGQLEIINCLSNHNALGIDSNVAGSVVRVSRTTVTRNTTSGINFAGGSILSYGNNEVAGNVGNNGPFSGGSPILQ